MPQMRTQIHTLKIQPATHKAAEYAVKNWHYSERLPTGKLVKYGAWENGKYIGVVIFSRGATPNIGKPFELIQTEIAELTRVALGEHETPTSKIVSIAVRMYRKHNTGTRLIVSYADPIQGHKGVLYQAMNWKYIGHSSGTDQIFIKGEIVHARTVFERYGTKKMAYLREHVDPNAAWTKMGARWIRLHGKMVHPRSLYAKYGTQSVAWLKENVDENAEWIDVPEKYKYVLPLDDDMAEVIEAMSKPYPK